MYARRVMIGADKSRANDCNSMNNNEKMSEADDPRSKEAIRTWLRLLSCETVIEQQLRTQFRIQFSTTLPQFDVLAELERADRPLTMSELSRELMVSNGNVTGVIDRLEKIGLVQRERAEHDRRIQFIRLTREGRRKFSRMAQQHEQWLDNILGDLTESDMTRLQALLLKARQSAVSSEISPE